MYGNSELIDSAYRRNLTFEAPEQPCTPNKQQNNKAEVSKRSITEPSVTDGLSVSVCVLGLPSRNERSTANRRQCSQSLLTR